MLDRPFLDKFSNATFFSKRADFIQSIKQEIINIIYSRLKCNISPFNFGTKDVVETELTSGWQDSFSKHISQQIIMLEPRISTCSIVQIQNLQDNINIVIKIKLKHDESQFFINLLY